MRKALVGALGAYGRYRRWRLQLTGSSEAEEAAARLASGQSWKEFCETLAAAGAALTFPGAPTDPLSQAEGYRYLTRLARAGLEAFIEYADPRAPVLHRVVHETVKMGADNPDNYYATARLDGTLEYRIRGVRNTVDYLAFGTQIGHYGKGGGLPPTGWLEATDMHVEADGSFEIILSAREPEGNVNWLPMTEETGTLVVRQTFGDRETETPAELHIERIGGETQAGEVTPELIDDGLKQASTLVAGASMLFAKWARDFQKHSNRLPQFDPEVSRNAGGDPNITYYHSHWALAPDQCLVIEVVPPACDNWNFQLNNYWMESLDYRYHTIHTNKHRARLEPDGSLRIVVAHEDPGHPNWIETVGHESGTMCFRWWRAEEPVEPGTRVVKLDALRAELGAP
jgi:hypothetical protein